MLVDDVDTEYVGSRKKLGQTRCTFTGAAAGIENASVDGNPVTLQEKDLLWPDGTSLSIQAAHHGFVGHLPGLRVEVGQEVSPRLLRGFYDGPRTVKKKSRSEKRSGCPVGCAPG